MPNVDGVFEILKNHGHPSYSYESSLHFLKYV